MSKLSEITSLFAMLASNLHSEDSMVRDEDDEELSVTISCINRSLNLTETQPRVRILDTALSLMCFSSGQVFESLIVHSVETIVAVLSSSIQCKVSRVGKYEVLRVGGSIFSQDFEELINVCVEILNKLEGHRGNLSPSIVHAVVRVAVMASNFPVTLGSDISIDVWKSSVSKLLSYIPKEATAKNGEIPVRLQLWYLDCEILKRDLTQILQEVSRRPFLCFGVELYERIEWHTIVICLALSPAMFIEARAMLHNWFLVTGLASVLELEIQLVLAVLDIVSRPMWWGLSMEIGSKMPFSLSYFPYKHQLIRTLSGPLSWESFQHLVHKITRFPLQKYYHASSENGPVNSDLVDHKSTWALAMNFPDWFLFSSLLLFLSPSTSIFSDLGCIINSSKTSEGCVDEVPNRAVAARFIAWILNPITESHQDLLVDYLTKISESWVFKKLRSTKSCETFGQYKEVKQVGLDFPEMRAVVKYDGTTVWEWLREFEDMCERYYRQVEISAPGEAHKTQRCLSQKRMLFRRMTLGLLLGFSGDIDEVGCELLLHYAATGVLFLLPESECVGLKHDKRNHGREEVPSEWTERYTAEEAVAGACIVFDLTDAIENMSNSLFETEEKGTSFMSHMKLTIGKYLIKCAKRYLLRTDIDNELVMLTDLCNSIVRWRHQGEGEDVFREEYKDMDDIIDALKCLSTSS